MPNSSETFNFIPLFRYSMEIFKLHFTTKCQILSKLSQKNFLFLLQQRANRCGWTQIGKRLHLKFNYWHKRNMTNKLILGEMRATAINSFLLMTHIMGQLLLNFKLVTLTFLSDIIWTFTSIRWCKSCPNSQQKISLLSHFKSRAWEEYIAAVTSCFMFLWMWDTHKNFFYQIICPLLFYVLTSWCYNLILNSRKGLQSKFLAATLENFY